MKASAALARLLDCTWSTSRRCILRGFCQIWNIAYEGREWDEEPLRVFVVPHSHIDPGWLKTVGEYYEEDVKGILETVVTTLSKVRAQEGVRM